jgi:hypothetical protein
VLRSRNAKPVAGADSMRPGGAAGNLHRVGLARPPEQTRFSAEQNRIAGDAQLIEYYVALQAGLAGSGGGS